VSDWSISGSYLEVCNCDAICPCRRIGGVAGGRSTYGECMGALSWLIDRGAVGDVDVAGLGVVLLCRYSDDEEGSPWSWVLHIDERAGAEQRAVLADVFAGRLGGTPLSQFPWAFKPSSLLAVVPSRIQIDHTPGRGRFRAGGVVDVRVAAPYEGDATVSCIIPGHHQRGREVVTELVDVRDERLSFSYSGRCGYEAPFSYSSDE
jgi:hypothetical protein